MCVNHFCIIILDGYWISGKTHDQKGKKGKFSPNFEIPLAALEELKKACGVPKCIRIYWKRDRYIDTGAWQFDLVDCRASKSFVCERGEMVDSQFHSLVENIMERNKK